METHNPVYLANVMLIVKKTISLCNQPPLSETDLGARAQDWMEDFEDVIPLERLPDAFKLARKDHKSTFPITAFEIKAAWLEIAELENKATNRIEQEERTLNRVAFCPDRLKHKSETEALQEYGILGTDFHWLPCHVCRSEAHAVRQSELMAARSAKSTEILSEFIQAINVRQMPTEHKFKNPEYLDKETA